MNDQPVKFVTISMDCYDVMLRQLTRRLHIEAIANGLDREPPILKAQK